MHAKFFSSILIAYSIAISMDSRSHNLNSVLIKGFRPLMKLDRITSFVIPLKGDANKMNFHSNRSLTNLGTRTSTAHRESHHHAAGNAAVPFVSVPPTIPLYSSDSTTATKSMPFPPNRRQLCSSSPSHSNCKR